MINRICKCSSKDSSWYSDFLQVGRPRIQTTAVVRFSVPIPTSPEDLYSGYQASFQGVKWLGPPLPSAPDEETVELYIYPPLLCTFI